MRNFIRLPAGGDPRLQRGPLRIVKHALAAVSHAYA